MIDSRMAVDAPGTNGIGPVNPSAGHRFDPFGDAKFSLVERSEQGTPSTVSLGSSSPSTPNSQRNRMHQAHIRTNFGKNQSYVPPQTANSPMKPVLPPQARRAAAWDDEDMPFDQMGLSRPVPQCTPPRVVDRATSVRSKVDPKPRPLLRPFDEPSAFCDAPEDEMVVVGTDASPDRPYYTDNGAEPRKVQVLRAYCSDTDRLRSASPSQRAQDRLSQYVNSKRPTSPLSGAEATTRFISNSKDYTPGDLPLIPDHAEESLQNYEEFGLSPGSATDSSAKKPRDALPRDDDPQATDDDSLFHFEEEERKRSKLANAKKSRRIRRTRKVEDDTSSLEADDSLQKRAQQAYQRRNRHLQKATTAPKTVTQIPTDDVADAVPEDEYPAKVDLFVNSPTTKIADNDTGDVETVASARSVNSEYTKSMESEVEDIFKDLFFIGSGATSKPGRRPFKFQSDSKRDSRSRRRDEDSLATDTLGTLEEDSTVDASYTGGTVATLNGENVSSGETSSGTKSGAKPVSGEAEADPDPLTIVWEFLEGGANMMGEALGISSPLPSSVCAPISQKQQDSPPIHEEETEFVLFSQPGSTPGVKEQPDASEFVFDEDELSPLSPETIDDVYDQITMETQ
jgi:hypothetical protein